jgi:hypothetical protein
VATLQAKKKRVAPVDFMLAGIVPDRANVVERAKVVELMKDIAFGNGSIQRSFVPDIVIQVMMTPPDQEHVVIGNSPAGVLCTMRYPLFEPQFFKPLEFVAIGSGQHSSVEIKKYADWLLAGAPGNDMVERSSLTDAVSQFIAENEIKDVGGMYLCVKIDRRGVGCLGIRCSMKYPSPMTPREAVGSRKITPPIGKALSACRWWCVGRARSLRAWFPTKSFSITTGCRRSSPWPATRR